MICELFPFQKQAVNEMRLRVAMALNNYRMLKIPQVVSLQAPTGSGKTIIMSALIEDIFYGSEQFTEQPEAIFVWLSDSPQLNEQSKQKIELKADKIRMDQCVVISDESFDREILEDGHIYFLNTQKLGKAGNLSRHSDTRQYTIWETIENTAREKADRLYFIIDEAHRGMQGRQAGTATTIMQRFIKGSSEQNLLPIPVVIGMSATAERFNSLVGQATNSTLHPDIRFRLLIPVGKCYAENTFCRFKLWRGWSILICTFNFFDFCAITFNQSHPGEDSRKVRISRL